MTEGWNVDRLETVLATWDEDIVIRTDPSWPERIWFARESAEGFWLSVRDALGPDPLAVERFWPNSASPPAALLASRAAA